MSNNNQNNDTNNNNEYDEWGYQTTPVDVNSMSDLDALLLEETKKFHELINKLGVSCFIEVQSPTDPNKFFSLSSLRSKDKKEDSGDDEPIKELTLLTSVVGTHIQKLTNNIFMVGPTRFFNYNSSDDDEVY